jgi:hypothetical protein
VGDVDRFYEMSDEAIADHAEREDAPRLVRNLAREIATLRAREALHDLRGTVNALYDIQNPAMRALILEGYEMDIERLENELSGCRLRRSAHTPAAQGSKWLRPSTRWAIYLRDVFACVYCGHIGRLTVDHIRSAEEGGGNEPTNLVTCCLSCNSSKQGISRRAWYARLRQRGINTKAVRDRIRRLTAKALDRERGRLLARRDDDAQE